MNNFSASDVLSLVGSIGILITAIGAVIVNIIVAMKTGKKVDMVAAQANEISHQVQEVHTITNSNLSAVKSDLSKAMSQISEMKVLVADLKNERDKLATITALRTEVVRPIMKELGVEEKTLKSIEKNTEITAENTALLPNVIGKEKRK